MYIFLSTAIDFITRSMMMLSGSFFLFVHRETQTRMDQFAYSLRIRKSEGKPLMHDSNSDSDSDDATVQSGRLLVSHLPTDPECKDWQWTTFWSLLHLLCVQYCFWTQLCTKWMFVLGDTPVFMELEYCPSVLQFVCVLKHQHIQIQLCQVCVCVCVCTYIHILLVSSWFWPKFVAGILSVDATASALYVSRVTLLPLT